MHNNPREADVLVVTGPVTGAWEKRLLEIYEKTPEPKIVVAVGACALSGGIFKEGHIFGPRITSYNVCYTKLLRYSL